MSAAYEKHRAGLLRGVILALLVILPIVLSALLLVFAFGGGKTWLFNEQSLLMKDSMNAMTFVRCILERRLTEPMARLNRLNLPADKASAANLRREYPEIAALYRISGKKQVVPIAEFELSPGFRDKLAAEMLKVKDSLAMEHVAWDSTLRIAFAGISVDNRAFTAGFAQREKDCLVAVFDPVKMKESLPGLLKRFEFEMPLFGNLFGRYPTFPGVVNFYDQAGELFHTLGKGLPTDWRAQTRQPAPYLPWEVEIVIGDESSERELYTTDFLKTMEYPYEVWIYFFSIIVCVALLPVLTPYLLGFRKKG